jgi:hypothetical protein
MSVETAIPVLDVLNDIVKRHGKAEHCEIEFTCSVPFWRKRRVLAYTENVTMLFVKNVEGLELNYVKCPGHYYNFKFSGPAGMVQVLVDRMFEDLKLKQV